MDRTELQTRIFAGQLLTLGAQKGSASLDAFSGWFFAGFGAAFALLLANLESYPASGRVAHPQQRRVQLRRGCYDESFTSPKKRRGMGCVGNSRYHRSGGGGSCHCYWCGYDSVRVNAVWNLLHQLLCIS